ncbi:hypothetical protein L218DRAFT_939780 [Marasmius fiardii PR-910]|nr:hypothetical protein L218DRAFT_939780 [Marasmius fiardii PR-910]
MVQNTSQEWLERQTIHLQVHSVNQSFQLRLRSKTSQTQSKTPSGLKMYGHHTPRSDKPTGQRSGDGIRGWERWRGISVKHTKGPLISILRTALKSRDTSGSAGGDEGSELPSEKGKRPGGESRLTFPPRRWLLHHSLFGEKIHVDRITYNRSRFSKLPFKHRATTSHNTQIGV